MKVLLLAAFVAMASAWVPGVRDQCNRVNTNGGSILLPHERYCQLYYSCDAANNQVPLMCPGRLLFAYGAGISVCVPSQGGFTSFTCPKWPCSSQQDIGRRYPDTCCGKYWECTAPNVFSEKVCNPGTNFDTTNEVCTTTSQCVDSSFCVDNIQPSNINDCRDTATSDPCTFRSEGWPEDRQCPVGTAFDQSTCQCSQFNEGCSASGVPADVLLENKKPDSNGQCRASGRMDFSLNPPRVVSDKLNRNINHYFYRQGGFSVNGQEGVFTNINNQIPFIYDYYYNDNTLYAPLAITMTVRFDFNNANLQLNTVYNLLENRWTTDPSNTHCQPTTLRFSARYQGVNLGDRRWEFTIAARGENLVDSSGTASITGTAQDYYRLVFTFGLRQGNTIGIGGSVVNRGNSGQINNGNAVNFQTDNRSMGSALRPNKCGFAIGRGLEGRIREFNVHEGCSSFAGLNLG